MKRGYIRPNKKNPLTWEEKRKQESDIKRAKEVERFHDRSLGFKPTTFWKD